uniref:Zgc:153352 n=1 Tax=Fundulus heteroclitus TaxID=8078 RepID=A0A3Q2QIK2_FUNHE
MAAAERVSVMMMYEDESVEVRYTHGAQLQLSPCGCEFTLLKATEQHGHPLQPAERVRQRTRFAVSAYKELLLSALAFRNKYASRPYLPEELITADNKKPFFSIDSTVKWPERPSYEPEFGPGGEITVRSEDGRATLLLSPSGEDFSVEFTCNLSQPQHHAVWGPNKGPDSQQQVNGLTCGNADPNEQMHQRKQSAKTSSAHLTGATKQVCHQPEQTYQTTTVIQHRSCFTAEPTWAYALSLARHRWTACSKATEAERTSSSEQADDGVKTSDEHHKDRESQLPQALPLTCPSPHWHRWKIKDSLVGEEASDLPTELVKILWCQGVTYRVLNGAVPVVEVSPGDGSLIRSNGVLNSYFTHHKPKLQSEQVREITYHLSSLPPDVPGQLYPVGSIISRANRILVCYNQAKRLLKFPAMPTCLQQVKHLSKPTLPEQNLSDVAFGEKPVNMPQTAGSLPDVVGAELEKIKRFSFLLENNHLLRRETEPRNSVETSPKTPQDEPVTEDYVAEALKRTSKAIKEIDALISAATLD